MFKKLFLRIILLISPFLVIVMSINVLVDSAFVFNSQSDKIARVLVSGKNARIKFIPSRLGSLQSAVLEERLRKNDTIPYDIMVFGTSRSAEISRNLFPHQTFFNCANPGGNILDYIALYGLYKRKRMLPTHLIISLDPWSFHSRKPVTSEKTILYVTDTSLSLLPDKDLNDDYDSGLGFLGLKESKSVLKQELPFFLKHGQDLLDLNYFQNNLGSVFDKKVMETDMEYLHSYFIIRSDGGFTLTNQDKVDSIYVEGKSNQFIQGHRTSFFVSSDTNGMYWHYFERLLAKLTEDGVTTVIFISPVNPIVYDSLSPTSGASIEEKANSFCRKNGILLIGSFNPHKYGLDRVSNFFSDPYHPVKSVVENIFYNHREELKNLGIDLQKKRSDSFTE
jgi:hypothetical protein